ncbi:ATP-dependent dethiobiotin synthetase BioD [Paraliomyxa miuraensis]|uniref:ATP-dependent dethiobiotin synthetase BioD n=1 Tax=Paraliomyxa miuraensis TaxID=376150 RepID=UPI0022542D24|nr:dethiobiotin synthase [Paraliomyxa miuraensis]MCX4244057.1 dethiobiotin synthase [Paraliomyxa miuraensis]
MSRSTPRPAEPTRIFVVGTDTAVGKTAVTSALLCTARARGLLAIPFKPAQSGPDRPSDIERLLAAAGLSPTELPSACPLRFDPPLAPGLAEDPTPFLSPASARSRAPHPGAPLVGIARALERWEQRHRPSLVFVEGAGGLHVPMPGGTWQPEWIVGLAPWTLVVGRTGLGTINHCLATIEGLRAIGRPPLGFVLSQTEREPDPSVARNADVIACASDLPCLGTLAHGPEPALVPEILDALLQRLGRAHSSSTGP